MNTITVKSATGTEIVLTNINTAITAVARGMNLGGMLFDGVAVKTAFAVRVGGKDAIVTMPIHADDLSKVEAMFAELQASVTASIADAIAYQAQVDGIKKMMNA